MVRLVEARPDEESARSPRSRSSLGSRRLPAAASLGQWFFKAAALGLVVSFAPCARPGGSNPICPFRADGRCPPGCWGVPAKRVDQQKGCFEDLPAVQCVRDEAVSDSSHCMVETSAGEIFLFTSADLQRSQTWPGWRDCSPQESERWLSSWAAGMLAACR